jgi:hypothetical protein
MEDDNISMEFEDEDDFTDFLIEMCIIQAEGVNKEGETLYKYNFERMKELMPELYQEIMDGVNDKIMDLFELGLVSVDYDENLTPHFSATPEGIEFFTRKHQSDDGG